MKEDNKILDEFVGYLKERNRSFKNHKSAIKKYFNYLEDYSMDYERIRICEAQKYQEYLSTLTADNGSLKYSSVTVLTSLGRITTFYDYLQKSGKVLINPYREIEKFKRAKSLPKNILNEKQMNRLLGYLMNFNREKNLTERRRLYRAHVLCELLYSTGARINEVSKLRTCDVDTLHGTVRLTDSKTGKKRDAFLNSYAEKVLAVYMQKMRDGITRKKNPGGTELVFGSRFNLVIWLNDILKDICEKLELPRITSHCFRHSFGFQMLKAGCDMRYIQDMLGHASLGSTQIYTKVDKEDLKCVLDTFHPRSIKVKLK